MLGLLQMISELVTERYEVLLEVGLDPLHSRHVLKTLRGSPKKKVQRGQYLPIVGLSYYKMYQSHPQGKAQQRGQYLLVVDLGLGCYKWYQKQSPDDVRHWSK